MNYIKIKSIPFQGNYFSEELQKVVEHASEEKMIQFTYLREIYEDKGKQFNHLVNEIRLRGACFQIETENPLLNTVGITKNEYIYVEDNQNRFEKLEFSLFSFGDFVEEYRVKDDRFFCMIPIEGFQIYNRFLSYEKLKKHFIECGYQVLSREEIRSKLFGECPKQSSIEELEAFEFSEELINTPIRGVFTENKEAQFVKFCESRDVHTLGQMTPEMVQEFQDYRGVGITKYQLVCTKIESLLSGEYELPQGESTYLYSELWDAIIEYDLGNKPLNELFEGRLLEYCEGEGKHTLGDIQVEIENEFIGISGIGKTKRDAIKSNLEEYIQAEKKEHDMANHYVIELVESCFEIVKDKTVKEVQDILGNVELSIENLFFRELQGRPIAEVGNPEDKVAIIKFINALNQLKSINEVLDLARESLTERELQVLEYRYGMGDTLEECGKKIECTRERVRQIEMKALDKYIKALMDLGFLASISFEFELHKYVSVGQVASKVSAENMNLLQAFLHREGERLYVPELELICLAGKQEIEELCKEIEDYLGEVIRFDEEEDLLYEMFQSIGITDLNAEELSKYLQKSGYRKSGYYYSRHKLMLGEMYSIIFRNETKKAIVLDEAGATFIRRKMKELFHVELTGEIRVIEARLVDCMDILNIAVKTYIHADNIEITQEMITQVERMIEERLANSEIVQSGDVCRFYNEELEALNIKDKHFFYTIAKRYFSEQYQFGRGNTMSIARIENAGNFYRTREEILMEKLREHAGKIKKKELLASEHWEVYKLEDTLIKSNKITSLGRYVWFATEYDTTPRIKELIRNSAKRYYERDQYVMTQKVYKDTVADPEVSSFYKSFGITNGKEIAQYIKYLMPELKGHTNILSKEETNINSIIDVITMKYTERCSKSEVYEFLTDCGYKEVASYNIIGRLIQENIYYQVDNDQFMSKEVFDQLFSQVYKVVKAAVGERAAQKEYVVLNMIADSLSEVLPSVDYRWTPELILSVINGYGYRKIDKEYTDYRTDRNIVVKENSNISRFDQLVYYIVKNEYTGVMHEAYICKHLMELGVLYNTGSKARKLPNEIHQSELFHIDELGRVSLR